MSDGYTSYKCYKQEVTTAIVECIAGNPIAMLSPFLAGRALEQGYVARTFDYNMMINYSNSS